MDKISVIIPVYNVEKFLRECLDSVINQTYKDLEIILIDDGSQDNSGAICDEYALKDQRIKVFHKENGGVASTRTFGLREMSGKYFSFVDSDDVVDCDYIKILKENLEKSSAKISVCSYLDFENSLPLSYKNTDCEIFDGKEFMKRILNGQKEFSVLWGKLYLAELFKNYKFQNFTVGEDEAFVNEISLLSKIVYCMDTLYFYRRNESSLINGKFTLDKLSGLESLEYRNDFLKKHDFNDFLDLNCKAILYKIIFLYFECKKAGYKKQSKDLKRKYKEYYNSKNTSFNKKDKFRLKLFKICPWVYRVITETNRRIKCRKK
ncbi:MAG TPA: glycosyl transferase family 2 [Clostridiales bacterium]|nr:glycosyl transferase family 2 [Clostridiales bacterium]